MGGPCGGERGQRIAAVELGLGRGLAELRLLFLNPLDLSSICC